MRRRHLLSAALTSAWVAPARSQDYPSRSVRVIVGFPPGGGTDLVARPLVQRLRSVLGQSGVVENRAGANGTIGLDAVAKSPPDGYTIGHVNSSVVVTNPLLYRNLPLNVATDIVPVCIVNESAAVIVVPEDVPARNLQEFVALARSQPGRFSFGSGGLGSGDHLGFELFRRATGVQILHVPYRGGGPALQDMMGGRIQMMISSFGMYRSQVEAGNLKVLAIFSRERQSYLPDVPTAVEQGWPDRPLLARYRRTGANPTCRHRSPRGGLSVGGGGSRGQGVVRELRFGGGFPGAAGDGSLDSGGSGAVVVHYPRSRDSPRLSEPGFRKRFGEKRCATSIIPRDTVGSLPRTPPGFRSARGIPRWSRICRSSIPITTCGTGQLEFGK
jgi:tripartite-type tricarboxylate transporter receptor subunit TctC